MILAIGEHLRVADWPCLFRINRAINVRYKANDIAYATSLSMIGSALRLPEIMAALTAIQQYAANNQPYLLHVFAKKIHGPAYGAIQAWTEQVDAQFIWHVKQPPGVDRDLALQHLIIARGLSCTESRYARNGESLKRVISDRLNTLSPKYWPPIFEAFLPGDYFGTLLWDCHFKKKFNRHIPSVSSELALMIALEFLCHPHAYADVSTLLRERFGVPDACARRVLDPLIANAISKEAMTASPEARNAWLMQAATQWRLGNADFAALVTDTFLKSFDEKVYRHASFSYILHGNFADLPDVERRVRERTIALERATIDALRDTGDHAEDQIDAFLTLIDLIGIPAHACDNIAALAKVAAMPLVGQPALLHRLVSNMKMGPNDHDIALVFIEAAIACRDALISSDANISPLVSRVSAALILTANALRTYDLPTSTAIVAEASDLAFTLTAPEDWGDVLQALIYDGMHGGAVAAARWAQIDKYIALFLCLPDASACYLPALSNRIEKIVGSVWGQLPDKADGSRSRFVVFKDRMGIKPEIAGAVLASIAESLVPLVIEGAHLLEDVATAADFADADAIDALETALFTFRIRDTLRADSDIDVVTNRYTKRSLYLRSRIARQVYDLRVLSDITDVVA